MSHYAAHQLGIHPPSTLQSVYPPHQPPQSHGSLYPGTNSSEPRIDDVQWSNTNGSGYDAVQRTSNDTSMNPSLSTTHVSFNRQQPTPEPTFRGNSFPAHHEVQNTMTGGYSEPRGVHGFLPNSNAIYESRSPQLQFDHAALLLSLAEEYVTEAYSLISTSEARSDPSALKEYYRLVATALGCLETVLEKCRLSPEREVTTRLRYATILHEETENGMEAEEALSKGISIADRHKLYSLKYNGQHLLVRMLFRTRPSAAFKYLDRILRDLEAYEHFDWFYAFGLLKVSLHLQLEARSRHDANSALSTLNKLMSLAEDLGDTAILATAAAQKAWLSLRGSITNESIEEAQTSLAVARRLQGSRAGMEVLPVHAIVGIVDLCCCLQQLEPDQAMMKTRHLQDVLSNLTAAKDWYDDGSFLVPLRTWTPPGSAPMSSNSIVRKSGADSSALVVKWLPRGDVSTVGHVLSGVVWYYQHKSSQRKAEEIFATALHRFSNDQRDSDKIQLPLSSAIGSQLGRQHRSSYIHLLLGFILCTRSQWTSAAESLRRFSIVANSWHTVSDPLLCVSELLKATISQAVGDLNAACPSYKSLYSRRQEVTTASSNVLGDVSLLAALNFLLIVGLPKIDQPGHGTASEMLSQLSKDCVAHPNRQIQAAYHLVHSTLPQITTIIGQKQTLQLCLNAAKASNSNLALCMALGVMYHYFFRDQVTEQAEKSARAAQSMARKVNNKIWISATARIINDHLEAVGRPADADAAFQEGWEAVRSLPPQIQAYLGWHEQTSTCSGTGKV